MEITRRDFITDIAFAAALVGLPTWASDLDEPPPMEMMSLSSGAYPWQWQPPAAPSGDTSIVTALNRIAFGARPGDFERVQQMGVDAFVEEQLAPETLDESALDERLTRQYPTLVKRAGDLVTEYPQQKKAVVPKNKIDRIDQLLSDLGLKEFTPGPGQVVNELQEATILRAVYSRRQLLETMVDFWSNHFNIYIGKNQDRWLKTVDDREVIRKYALGNFRDLLAASAASPAMLEYLDNRLNVRGVPNENYAREIMELHTLGVNGGYTQKDVQELARCFTGWTIRPPQRDFFGGANYAVAGTFLFNPKQHDDGTKRVLGIDIPTGGGIDEALKIIDVLAHHPSTARFIAAKLVTRYVSDTPPDSLVQQAAHAFTESRGDIRTVLGVILHSPEFKNSFAQKIRRPFELVVSIARALDIQLDDALAPALALRVMGQGLFQHLTPDGYPDSGAAWINTGGLLARWNLALLAANNRIPKGRVDLGAAMSSITDNTVGAAVDFWIARLLHRTIPDTDRQRLIQAVGGGEAVTFDRARLPDLVALILASPHFQYR